MYHVDQISLDYRPRERVARIVPELQTGVLMYEFDSAFVCGLLQKFKPRRILEVGVANGGTTAVMLQCMKDLGTPFSLRSVDILTKTPKNPSREIGYLGVMAAEALDVRDFQRRLGVILPQVIESLAAEEEGKFDFLILDTNHSLPGETLDFLVAFPFLSPNAVVCLHDIRQNQKTPPSPYKIGSNALFNSVVAEKYVNTDATRIPDYYPNTGAFQITKDTSKYINNVFGILTENWLRPLNESSLAAYNDVLRRRYAEESLWIYEKAVIMNHNSTRFIVPKKRFSNARKLIGRFARKIGLRK